MAGQEILTPAEMYQADAHAVETGITGLALMERAGEVVFEEIVKRWWPRRVLVACGPGNNGGDGFVVARYLAEAGWPVDLCLVGNIEALKGDAAAMAARWPANVLKPDEVSVAPYRLIVDCLFGAGLAREIDGEAARLIHQINDQPCPVVAVDLPSGIDGLSGAVKGIAVKADLTVTFFRRKPAHLLSPGRYYCKQVVCRNIGIPASALEVIGPKLAVNLPDNWCRFLPSEQTGREHKYDRGLSLVVSGGEFATGAARLSAQAALRAGSGLIRIAGEAPALRIQAAHLTSHMLALMEDARGLQRILTDKRYAAICIGPGAGLDDDTRAKTRICLNQGCPVVLDADALTAFAQSAQSLFDEIAGQPDRAVVLTPHDGEFNRLFADLAALPDKVARARQAAARSGAVVVLKGGDTVIAGADGQAVINAHAPAWLATAGSGDVLAGLITGLLAQGMPGFAAACAAVWLHGQAAFQAGAGLIAEDLPDQLPAAFEKAQFGAGLC